MDYREGEGVFRFPISVFCCLLSVHGGPGGDLLSHALRRSTIGAKGFHGRVRDGIGCWAPCHGHQAPETPASQKIGTARLNFAQSVDMVGGEVFDVLVIEVRNHRRHQRVAAGLALLKGSNLLREVPRTLLSLRLTPTCPRP